MAFLSKMFPQRAVDTLCNLAAYGSLEQLKDFYDDDIDINQYHSEVDATALAFASQAGHLDNVMFLISKGAKNIHLALMSAKIERERYLSGKLTSSRYTKEEKIKKLDEVMNYLKEFLHRDRS